jgi:integrase
MGTRTKGYYLTRRNNGYYYVGIRTGKTVKWRSLHVKTRSEALHLFSTLSPSPLPKPPESRITLSEFFTILNERLTGVVRPRTLRSYGISVKSFIRTIGDKPLPDITINDIEVYKTRLIANTVKPISVNVYLRSLKAIIQRAVKWEYISVNVWKNVELLRVPHREVAYLLKDDLQSLLKVTEDEQLRDVYTVACYTGCRLNELINIQFKYIDFDSNSFRIANTDHFETKSGKERVIPMVSLVRNIFLNRLKVKGTSDYLFHANNRPLTRDVISRTFKKGVRRAGLNPQLHFHSTRHTAASWMLMAGIGVHTVKDILGHSSTDLIDKVYGHLSDRFKQTEMNKLEMM